MSVIEHSSPEDFVNALIRLQNRTAFRYSTVILLVFVILFSVTVTLFWMKSSRAEADLALLRRDVTIIKDSLKVNGIIIGLRQVQFSGQFPIKEEPAVEVGSH